MQISKSLGKHLHATSTIMKSMMLGHHNLFHIVSRYCDSIRQPLVLWGTLYPTNNDPMFRQPPHSSYANVSCIDRYINCKVTEQECHILQMSLQEELRVLFLVVFCLIQESFYNAYRCYRKSRSCFPTGTMAFDQHSSHFRLDQAIRSKACRSRLPSDVGNGRLHGCSPGGMMDLRVEVLFMLDSLTLYHRRLQ